MKIQPICRYKAPRFPTQYVLNTHPELLRLVPARWKSNPVVLSALGAVSAMLIGCHAGQGRGHTEGPLEHCTAV